VKVTIDAEFRAMLEAGVPGSAEDPGLVEEKVDWSALDLPRNPEFPRSFSHLLECLRAN
jgi:hypothetical protein